MSLPDFAKVKLVSKNWWKQYDFEFMGVPCQYVVFPRDRLMCFTREKLNKRGEQESMMIPPFNRLSKSIRELSLEEILSQCITDFEKEQGSRPKDTHLYLCAVEGFSVQDLVGMVVLTGKASPTTDYYFDAIRKMKECKREIAAFDSILDAVANNAITNKSSEEVNLAPFDYIPGLAQKR